MRGLGIRGGASTASEAGEPLSVCGHLQEDTRLLARSRQEHGLRPGSPDGPEAALHSGPGLCACRSVLSRPECAGGGRVLCPSLAPMLFSRTSGPDSCWATCPPALAPWLPHPGHHQPALATSLPSSLAWGLGDGTLQDILPQTGAWTGAWALGHDRPNTSDRELSPAKGRGWSICKGVS